MASTRSPSEGTARSSGSSSSIAPLAAMGLIQSRWPSLPRSFAGFCLTANDVDLVVGSFGGIGDAGHLLRHGSPRWALIVSGLVGVPAGLSLWHGLGPHLGPGEAKGRVDRRAAVGTLGVLLAVGLIEVLIERG